jgi:hypothetical protein
MSFIRVLKKIKYVHGLQKKTFESRLITHPQHTNNSIVSTNEVPYVRVTKTLDP